LLPVVVVVVLIALVPISIVQRYRLGTSRQRARSWLITINLVGLGLSSIAFLIGAAFTGIWVPDAFRYGAMGLTGGCALGIVGLWLTKWEPSREALFYTPNRLLVLAITLTVIGRLFYGFWRAVHAWRVLTMAESGVAGSMAAGGVVIGYYLAYSVGVRRRMRKYGVR
jgi:hypothetical protein